MVGEMEGREGGGGSSRGCVVGGRPEGQLGPLTMTVQCSGRPACQPGQQIIFIVYNRRRRDCVHQPAHLNVAPTQHCHCSIAIEIQISNLHIYTFLEDHVLNLSVSDHLNSPREASLDCDIPITTDRFQHRGRRPYDMQTPCLPSRALFKRPSSCWTLCRA